jgi:hypothetical protein
MMVCFNESLRMRRLRQREAYEKAAKKQNFSAEEQPHPDLRGIELLLEGGEVML